jgi:uncharacterized protein (TIGR00369 family)
LNLFGDHERGRELSAALAAISFDNHIGTEWLELGSDEPRARLAVEDHHKQPGGTVHGGVFATLAEGLCSVATYAAVVDDDVIVMGQSNHTTFLRPIVEGHVNVVASPRHRGRTIWVWEVEISDDGGRVCGLTRMTIAIRPARAGDARGSSRDAS